MAPQITLFLEFLYGFLCAPIVLIFGIENVEYMVFLTDKNILFKVWMYIQNCTSNISMFIFDWCRGPDTHSRHYKCWFRAVSSHVRLREYHTFISLQNSHARHICSFLLSNNKGWNLRKIGRLVFKQLLLTGFVSVKSVRTKDLLSGSRASKASHHFSSYRVIEQA